MSPKAYELYEEVFIQLKRNIKQYSGFDKFDKIKIVRDFEITLRKTIKKCFSGCIL